MSRHRNVRKINFEDELSDDVYGRSLDDVDYAVSPSTEQEFMFNRDIVHQHTLSSFLEEPSISDDREHYEIGGIDDYDNDDAKYDEVEPVKPKLDPENEAKLRVCIEKLEDILGDSCHEPTAIEAAIKYNYDVERALDHILGSSGKQTFQSSPPTSYKQGYAYGFSEHVIPTKSTRNTLSENINGRGATPLSGSSTPKQGSRSQSSENLANDSIGNDSPVIRTPKSTGKQKEKIDIKVLFEKRRDGKDHLNLVVIGHVDAGKSTLMGHLLFNLGNVSKRVMHKNEMDSKKLGKGSFAYAWVLDETEEERTRGITMDVAMTTFETETKVITLMDAPGHRDFIPNMIQGTSQADCAILVVDASRGEFEAGFESGGQTREHALLARSLGINQLTVAVNKLDMVGWSEERFLEIESKLKSFLKQVGFKESDVGYVACSGLTGENLTEPCSVDELKKWYKGRHLLAQIDTFRRPERPLDKPFRFCVSDVFKGQSSAFIVAGKIESGYVQNGDKVLLMPANESGLAKALMVNDEAVPWAVAGDHASMTVTGIDIAHVSCGSIICDRYNPVAVTSKIIARLVVFNTEVPITKGFMVVYHSQSLSEPATITKLVSILNKSSGEIVKKRPRCLPKQANAVVEIRMARPICASLYKDNKVLGRFMLRYGGKTVGAGVVTEIK